MQMGREEYRAVKRMNKDQMNAYIQRTFRRGYEAGVKATLKRLEKDPVTTGTDAPAPSP